MHFTAQNNKINTMNTKNDSCSLSLNKPCNSLQIHWYIYSILSIYVGEALLLKVCRAFFWEKKDNTLKIKDI